MSQKSNVIRFRASPEDADQIAAQAKAAGYSNVSSYIRAQTGLSPRRRGGKQNHQADPRMNSSKGVSSADSD